MAKTRPPSPKRSDATVYQSTIPQAAVAIARITPPVGCAVMISAFTAKIIPAAAPAATAGTRPLSAVTISSLISAIVRPGHLMSVMAVTLPADVLWMSASIQPNAPSSATKRPLLTHAKVST